ncbi:DNA polymerase III subunit alpha [Streptacidiphilus albus]|uniref:DNA polymerase III subunit alpha n=1 Tax=Streptacidiphilus albus TaxID=105425 RepID=UPI00054B1B5C
MVFTHLHVASGYSARYGASLPQELARRAAERGLDALALTDRDTVAGVVRFAKACAEAGIRPLFGVDLAVPEYAGSGYASERRDRSAEPSEPAVRRRSPARGGAFVDESAPRALLLARDRAGWAALCGAVTAAHAGPGPAALDWPDLARAASGATASNTAAPGAIASNAAASNAAASNTAAGGAGAGLYVLLGPGSEVGRALAAGRPDRAARLLRPWRELFGAALRLEVVHHARPGTGPGSLRLAARTLGFAAEQGVAAVLSNDVRYADPGRGRIADVLDAARLLVPIDVRRSTALDGGERWLKDGTDMARLAEQVAEAAGQGRDGGRRLLAATAAVAEGCRLDPADDLGIGRVHFPEPDQVGAGHRGADRVLRSRVTAAMVVRGHHRERRYWDRLEQELGTIARLGYAGYFLTVAQVVDDARALGIRVAARGSAAGSLAVHLLGIAAADPVEHGLIMERFLSERRAALPDIDIDVESARRLEVYRAVFDRFGAERTATLAMPETYRVRHAVRDVGAALGLDPQTVDRLAKAFPHIRARDARAALSELPELRAVAAEDHGPLWELVEGLDGLSRGTAMHPCGVIISDATLLYRTPVVPTPGEGFAMSQFDKEDVEDLGLLKLDVLGVRMQSAMAHSVAEITRATGEELDLDDRAQVPMDDPAVFELIRSAETLGCFQVESPGQRDLVGRLQPQTFHDLVVDISLFRPGPVSADMVRPFIEARHGRSPAHYPHPDLEEALRETYGVVVFHEQVIEILHVMTGCDRDEADEMRRALSNPDRQGRVRAWFGERARERGYGPEVLRRTWEILAAFGAYGFCKAHATAFAVPTYQSAWLKAHRAAAFYAGVLTHDPGMYPKRLLLADARRRGVPVLPLDANRSAADFRIELVSGLWGVRVAFSEVQGITEDEIARLTAGQPYTSLPDLWQRARPSRPLAERLVQVGALDALAGRAHRRDLLLQLTELHHQDRARARAGAADGQLPLLGAATGDAGHPRPSGLPDLDADARLGAELDILGLDTSRHLMTSHHAFLAELGVTPAGRLRSLRNGAGVLVAGIKAATQTPPIRSGRRVIFTTLDDGSSAGLVDLAFFEDSHDRCAATVFHNGLLLVRGTLQRRGPQSLSVVGTAAWSLAELAELRRTGGLAAVAARLAEDERGPERGSERGPERGARTPGGGVTGEADQGRGPLPESRRIHLATGYELHPWADLQPPGRRTADSRRLWHSSPGSAG